jgi:eukaryotic-like serine/threonine-protein kinase
MKKGDVIGDYVLTTDPREGGGHSEWAFASKRGEVGGEEYFLKRFLQPTFPLPESPGGEQTKAAKRRRCDEFERLQRLIIRKLRPISGEGGNLVITKDFFRERAFYYKVTARVEVSDIGPRGVAGLPRDDRIFIMLTAAKSLDTLHKAGLVHGDVKPENLLIKALDKGHFAVKVIDFDNCFPVSHPPVADQLVGDPAYYSPELLLYNIGRISGDQLNEKSDVFALGLVFWQYLTGGRPALPPGANYPAEAIEQGSVLALPRSMKDEPIADLVHRMLLRDAESRPSMGEVHSGLKLARRFMPEGKPGHTEPAKPVKRGLGGRLFRRITAPSPRPPAAAPPFAMGFGGGAAEPVDGARLGYPSAEPPAWELRGVPPAADGAEDPTEAMPASEPRLTGKLAREKAGEGRLRGSLLRKKGE